MKTAWRFLLLSSIGLVGCTSLIITSTKHNQPAPGEGLSYCLPKGWLKISLTRAEVLAKYKEGGAISVKSTTIPISYNVDVILAPDRQERYLLNPALNVCADDFIQLKVTNSLLESVSLTNSDQSLGILSNLVETAIGALQAAYSPFKENAELVSLTTNYFVTNVFLMDPFDEIKNGDTRKLVEGITLELSEFKLDAKACAAAPIDVPSEHQTTNTTKVYKSPKDAAEPSEAGWNHTNDFSGVYYRPLEAYRITLDFQKYGSFQTLVYVPNKALTLRLAANRAAFVKQSINIVFSQGIPQSVTINKPSQALAVTTLPLTMLKSLTSIPTNLIQFRINLGGNGGSSSNASASTNSLVTVQQSNTVTSNSIQVLQQPAPLANSGRSGQPTNTPPKGPEK